MKLRLKFPSLGQLLLTFVPAITALLLIFPIMNLFELKMRWVIKSIAAIAKVHPLTGYLSNIGMLMWCATVAITLLTAFAVRKQVSARRFWFLLSTSALSFVLLVDDLFMFHETLAPRHLGISENVIYIFYILATLAYIGFFYKEILQTKFIGLFMALGFFAVSVGCDYFQNVNLWMLGEWEYFIEEGLKWIGLAWWCSYYAQMCCETIRSQLRPVESAQIG